jgi:MFS family permease
MARPSRVSASSTRGSGAAALLLAATTLARIPVTVLPVLFILQSEVELGRLDIGGFAVLAYSVGAMVNGLLAGWLFTVLGHRTVAVLTGVLTVAGLLCGAATTDRAWAYIPVAAVIGLCFPPLHIGSRATYPRLLDDRTLLRFYSIDVSVIQITWIVAPVLVVAVAGSVGVPTIYLLLACLTAIGTLWYVLLARGAASSSRAPAPTWASVRPLLSNGRMHVYLLVAGGMMASSGFVLTLIIASMPSNGEQSGAILVWSVGSTVGSLVVNRQRVSRLRLVVGLSVAAAALAASVWIGGVLAMDIALFLLGFATAPVTAAVFYFTSQHFRSRHQVLVFGVITSVQLVSEGIGTSVGGILIDAGLLAWVWGIELLVLVAVLAIVGANARRAFTHSPVPRTDAISIVPGTISPYPEKP